MRKKRPEALVASIALLTLLGCGEQDAARGPDVEIGVFYGGQIQRINRVEVPRVHPPNIGFRVSRPKDVRRGDDARRDLIFQLEVTRPGPSGRRVIERSDVKLAKDQERVDVVLPLGPTEELGVWNIRLTDAGKILADRALYLVSG